MAMLAVWNSIIYPSFRSVLGHSVKGLTGLTFTFAEADEHSICTARAWLEEG
jgi:hypothetical protein